MRRLTICIIFVMLAVSGCASTRGMLGDADFPEVVGSNAIEPVLVATTRARSEDPSEFYASQRAPHLNFAEVGVSIPPAHKSGRIEKAIGRPDPARHFVSARRSHLNSDADFVRRINDELRRRRRGHEVFVFVHGFNNTFAEGLYRAAQIRHDFDLPAVAVHYSWPSAAEARLYAYDRDSANFARDGLVEVLDLLGRSNARRVLVVAHSMGSLVTMEALRQARLTGRSRVFRKLNQVVLASPDIDVDIFREQMKPLRISNNFRMAVLVSSDDRALRLSQRLRGGHPRIGQGSNIDELRNMGITVFDLSKLEDGDRLSHSKFSASPSFIELIRKQYITRDTIRAANSTDQQSTVTAGSIVGDAADLVIRLPGQILTPNP